jgi:predicted esterase
MNDPITRRRFVGLSLAGAATVACAAGGGWVGNAAAAGTARLQARPGKPNLVVKTGMQDLGLAKGRDGVLSVPEGYRADKPVPLIVMLHGAIGRTAEFFTFCQLAAAAGIAVVEPDSRAQTWDFFKNGYGPETDIAFLDRTLEHVFAQVAVDPRRLVLAGFSDGASFALSAGLPNGDLFTRVMAFSPGFMVPPSRQGKPHVWVSHGNHDGILPVEASRKQIVPQLKEWGYDVRYREFDGGHEVSPDLMREAFRWFLA